MAAVPKHVIEKLLLGVEVLAGEYSFPFNLLNHINGMDGGSNTKKVKK